MENMTTEVEGSVSGLKDEVILNRFIQPTNIIEWLLCPWHCSRQWTYISEQKK